MYDVIVKRKAARYLSKMPKDRATQFTDAFKRIANQDTDGLHIQALGGLVDGYRLRFGGYRAIYTITDKKLQIEVIDVGQRGDIYK